MASRAAGGCAAEERAVGGGQGGGQAAHCSELGGVDTSRRMNAENLDFFTLGSELSHHNL